jgi:phosphatidylserine synthase
MTSMGSGTFCYNYTPSLIGTYDFRGISNGCVKSFAVYVPVTPRGESYNGMQTGIIAAQGILILLFMALGFSFGKEKWKLRGFFFVLSMLVGVLMLNSIRILTGTSASLDSMVSSGMIIGIVAVSFMAVYLLIIYTIEIFSDLKNKKEMKWKVSKNFN